MMRVSEVQSAARRGSEREDFGEQNTGAEDDDHGGENYGEGAVAAVFVAGFAIAVEDGNEGDGGGAADEEVVEEVGEGEGGAVGVLRGAGSKEGVDVADAHEREQTGAEGAQHEQDGG